jgi:hypothetical protein
MNELIKDWMKALGDSFAARTLQIGARGASNEEDGLRVSRPICTPSRAISV